VVDLPGMCCERARSLTCRVDVDLLGSLGVKSSAGCPAASRGEQLTKDYRGGRNQRKLVSRQPNCPSV
jgi:hypothetical protein